MFICSFCTSTGEELVDDPTDCLNTSFASGTPSMFAFLLCERGGGSLLANSDKDINEASLSGDDGAALGGL